SFFVQAEDGIRGKLVTGVQTCALPIYGVRRMWGPGRHLAGNNLFSYYFDPEGNVVEYTTEVEQITSDDYVPPLRPRIADQWGSKIGRASCRERVGGSGGCGRGRVRMLR